jgi:hypothetical protein
MSKFCKKCDTETRRYENGRCSKCAAKNARKWNIENPDICRKADRKYKGLPLPTRPMPEFCEWIGCVEKANTLDHCHITGKFRGWLCGKHNRGLGQCGDTIESLRGGIMYLEVSFK